MKSKDISNFWLTGGTIGDSNCFVKTWIYLPTWLQRYKTYFAPYKKYSNINKSKTPYYFAHSEMKSLGLKEVMKYEHGINKNNNKNTPEEDELSSAYD